MYGGACRGQKKALISLELKLQAAVSYTMQVIRIEVYFSAKVETFLKTELSLEPIYTKFYLLFKSSEVSTKVSLSFYNIKLKPIELT